MNYFAFQNNFPKARLPATENGSSCPQITYAPHLFHFYGQTPLVGPTARSSFPASGLMSLPSAFHPSVQIPTFFMVATCRTDPPGLFQGPDFFCVFFALRMSIVVFDGPVFKSLLLVEGFFVASFFCRDKTPFSPSQIEVRHFSKPFTATFEIPSPIHLPLCLHHRPFACTVQDVVFTNIKSQQKKCFPPSPPPKKPRFCLATVAISVEVLGFRSD